MESERAVTPRSERLKSTSPEVLDSCDRARRSRLATSLCTEMSCLVICSSETLPDMRDSTLFHWKGGATATAVDDDDELDDFPAAAAAADADAAVGVRGDSSADEGHSNSLWAAVRLALAGGTVHQTRKIKLL